jgi:hypothetical protein
MKITCAVAVLALAATAAGAGPLPLRLKDGAVWRQTIVKTRSDERDGKTVSATVTSVMQVTYRAHPGQPATLEEALVAMTSDDLPASELAPAIEQAKLLFPVVVEVDGSLKPVRVLNWAELREKALMGVLPERESKAAQAASGIFGKIDDRTAANFFKELALVSLAQNTSLTPGQTTPYESEVANALGGPPIKTRGELKLETYDPRQKRAVMTWSQSLDPASAAESIRATAERLAAQGGPAEGAKAQLADFRMTRDDACRYEIETTTGMVTRADCTAISTGGAKSQSLKRTERWLITQTLPENR